MQAKRGAKLVLFAFSDENPDPWRGPDRCSKADLHRLFNKESGWCIESITATQFDIGKQMGSLKMTDHVWRLVAVCIR